LYHTPDEPHQPALFPVPTSSFSFKSYNSASEKVRKQKIAAVYVTRFQKERWTEKQQAYPRIDAKFLKDPKYSRASVLHPLPRVGELDASLDSDSRATYFEQAAYGVPIRMALISLLLGLEQGKTLATFEAASINPNFFFMISRCQAGSAAEITIASCMRRRKPLMCATNSISCEKRKAPAADCGAFIAKARWINSSSPTARASGTARGQATSPT